MTNAICRTRSLLLANRGHRRVQQASVIASWYLAIQGLHRLFTIPGVGHAGTLIGAGTGSSPIPMPNNALGKDELFTALMT